MPKIIDIPGIIAEIAAEFRDMLWCLAEQGEIGAPIWGVLASVAPNGAPLAQPKMLLLPVATMDERMRDDKDAVVRFVRQLARRSGAYAVLMGAEAFISHPSPEELSGEESRIMPSEHPERMEVLIVSVESHDGHQMWRADIKNHLEGRDIDPWTELPLTPGQSSGRFVGLLTPLSASPATPEGAN